MDDEALAYLLGLRLRLRGRAEATAIVDRCLALLGRAATADAAEVRLLDIEIERMRDELALRFGAPHSVSLQ
jgi:hypothetical protein